MCNVFSFLMDSAKKYPEKIYIADKGEEFSYSDIYNSAINLAGAISAGGLASGERIMIYLDNSAEYITALFAVFALNCIAVPVNKNTATDAVCHIIADSAPRILITNSIYIKRLQQSQVDLTGIKIIDTGSLIDQTKDRDFTFCLSAGGSLPALILYTSGTSRMPKGVVLTHNNLTANTESIIEYLGLTSRDSLLAIVNFGYSYGNSTLLTHTKAGGKIVIENRVSYPLVVMEALHTSRATGFSTVGSYLNTLLKQEAFNPSLLEHLRYMTFAGESTNFDDIKRLNKLAPHLKIFIMYGQTEASARLSYLDPDLILKKPGSIGKGMPGVTLKVITEDGREAPAGTLGEIIAFGRNIMQGYWHNEEETAAVIKDGWLYTGDLAVTDEDGYIYIKGRKDDIIKHLGHRISPVEIEAAMNSYESVLESAVIGVDNTIKAFVVPKNDTLTVEGIAAHLKKRLPAFKRPDTIEIIKTLPRTDNGKIKRSELKKIFNLE